jgi:hypothetical protein
MNCHLIDGKKVKQKERYPRSKQIKEVLKVVWDPTLGR